MLFVLFVCLYLKTPQILLVISTYFRFRITKQNMAENSQSLERQRSVRDWSHSPTYLVEILKMYLNICNNFYWIWLSSLKPTSSNCPESTNSIWRLLLHTLIYRLETLHLRGQLGYGKSRFCQREKNIRETRARFRVNAFQISFVFCLKDTFKHNFGLRIVLETPRRILNKIKLVTIRI